MTVDDFIKKKLLERGFTEKDITNNRGLISATIDETMFALSALSFQENKNIKVDCEHEWCMSPDSFDQSCYCRKCGKMS